MSRRIAAHTLGCKTNQYDTQAMLEQFISGGYEVVGFDDQADVYLINTCSVTAMADKKSRQFIRRARASKDAVVLVCGCMSQKDGDALKKLGADIIIGTDKRQMAHKLVSNFRGEAVSEVGDVSHIKYEELTVSGYDNTRALLKIQEGCDNYCAYCIIASLRGNPRSRGLSEIQDEAERLARNGYREIVLTGTNLALFGKDSGYTLKDAIDSVCKSGIERVRLGSLDPGIFSEEFISYLALNEKVCRHFHISLQSGCERTLVDMGRNYTAAQYKSEIETIWRYMPKSAISTDVMVGFAGETDERFDESLKFVSGIGFCKVHVFPYSIRPNTRAAKFEGQVTRAVKQNRADIMQKAADLSRERYIKSIIGEEVTVLLETKDENGDAFGYSDEYIRVRIEGGADNLGGIVRLILSEDNIADEE